MKDGARCSRIPPRVVSRRATKERLSWRNSIEHTVSSSTSSRTGFATGAVLGFGEGAFGEGFPGFVFFFATFAFGFGGRFGLEALRGFLALAAGIHE